jgi:hypothetical protein
MIVLGAGILCIYYMTLFAMYGETKDGLWTIINMIVALWNSEK